MKHAPRPCRICRKQVYRRGLCRTHHNAYEHRRGTPKQRGYNERHRTFRAAVLLRDPVCILCGDRESSVADHYPLTLRELMAQGLDPYDPKNGRGLCYPCHNSATARATFT